MKELEMVVANWLREADSPLGQIEHATDKAAWLADRIVAWHAEQVGRALEDLDASALRYALEQLGGWNRIELAEAMEELTHLEDAIGLIKHRLARNPG
jgi:hypothetical protein